MSSAEATADQLAELFDGPLIPELVPKMVQTPPLKPGAKRAAQRAAELAAWKASIARAEAACKGQDTAKTKCVKTKQRPLRCL